MDSFDKIRSLKVDVCCGLAWGDEAKGKIVSQLASSGKYNFVCRWAGGHNAGHTIYKNNIKSDDLINQNNVIRQNSYTSNKGSFKGKGSNDALK